MSHKLPEEVSPINYELFFEPDFKKFIFKGKVLIEAEALKEEKVLRLNYNNLKIINAFVNNEKARIKLNPREEIFSLYLKKKLVKGINRIKIDFEGALNDNLSGFYRSAYKNKGKTKYIATTQFEAPYARQAFPCFDQPDKKATFSVTLKIDAKHEAISNMPVIEETKGGGRKIVRFEKTPKMSTYLLYFGVGDFEFIEDKYRNIRLRVATVPGKSKGGRFALSLTKKFLKYFENYSGINYPLPKLDLIAVPDFSAGAMENWGAITFREILLLYDKNKTSFQVKRRIAEVVAHELWHQWSGNLVTMKWWDDLWLNESFATFMAYKAVEHCFPEWKFWEEFLSDATAEALFEDSLKTTHSIAVKVKSPNEIEEIFDAISYSKGGSILKMIEAYLSPEVFRKGVSLYLKKNKYGNAEAADLWTSLGKVSNKPIEKIMENWIKQKGYPLVKLKRGRISQEPFNSKDRNLWLIPLVIKSGKKIVKKMLDKKEANFSISSRGLKLNAYQEGFYRVKYEGEFLASLREQISENKLRTFDRWGVENDLFNLTFFGKENLSNYFELVKLYKKENSLLVLEDIYLNLRKIFYLFSNEERWKEAWPLFKDFLNEPYDRIFKKLGWEVKETDTSEERLFRLLALRFLSFSENKFIIGNAFEMFNNILKGKKFNSDILGIVYSIVAKNGGLSEHEKLLGFYKKTEDSENKLKILSSLFNFKNPELLKKSFDFALTKDVRTQDLRSVFSSIMVNPSARGVFFPWVKKNWKKLEKYQNVHFVFMAFLESLITNNTSEKAKLEIRNFIKSKKIKYKKTQANSFEILDLNIGFVNKNRKILMEYFEG